MCDTFSKIMKRENIKQYFFSSYSKQTHWSSLHICIQNDISFHATAAITSFHCNEFNECFDLRTLPFNNNFHFHYFDTCEIKISRQYNKKLHLTIELHPRL